MNLVLILGDENYVLGMNVWNTKSTITNLQWFCSRKTDILITAQHEKK